MLYTAQYNYRGPDRLDITAKGQDNFGKIFAPTWHMVRTFKQAEERHERLGSSMTVPEEWYTTTYYDMMKEVWENKQPSFDYLIQTAKGDNLTLVCFCPAGKFCHRLLLKDIIVSLSLGQVAYGGER